MTEQQSATALAAWLRGEISGVPDDLDPEVADVILSLRPDMAPPPGLTAAQILTEICGGPLSQAGAAMDNVVAFPVPASSPDFDIDEDPVVIVPSWRRVTRLTPILVAALVLLAIVPHVLRDPSTGVSAAVPPPPDLLPPPEATSHLGGGGGNAVGPPPPVAVPEDQTQDAQADADEPVQADGRARTSHDAATPAKATSAPLGPQPTPTLADDTPTSAAPTPLREAPSQSTTSRPTATADMPEAAMAAPSSALAAPTASARRAPISPTYGGILGSPKRTQAERINTRLKSASHEGEASVGWASPSWRESTSPELVHAIDALLQEAEVIAQTDPIAAAHKLAKWRRPPRRAAQVVAMAAVVYARQGGDLALARQIAENAINLSPSSVEAAELRRFLASLPNP